MGSETDDDVTLNAWLRNAARLDDSGSIGNQVCCRLLLLQRFNDLVGAPIRREKKKHVAHPRIDAKEETRDDEDEHLFLERKYKNTTLLQTSMNHWVSTYYVELEVNGMVRR